MKNSWMFKASSDNARTMNRRVRARPPRSRKRINEWIEDDNARDTILREMSSRLDEWLPRPSGHAPLLSHTALVHAALVRILQGRGRILERRITLAAFRSELFALAYEVCADARNKLDAKTVP